MLKKHKYVIAPILAVLSYILSGLAVGAPVFLEGFYARGINRATILVLSNLTGILPFSLAEWLVIGQVPLFFLFAYRLVRKKMHIKQVVFYVSGVYVAFVFLWGLNYSRMSVGEMLHLSSTKTSYQVLQSVALALTEEANAHRVLVNENEEGVFSIEGGYPWVFDQAKVAFDNRKETLPILGGNFGKPKPIALSKAMLYTGITGVYFPFTAEANVNVAIMDLLLPATVLHEMAHQRGIAAEDEANFIAYYAATAHPEPSFRYSGTMLALIHVQNALYRVAPDLSMEVASYYSDGVRRDLVAQKAFWVPYQGKTNEVSNKVNDAYLKSNRQTDGVASYGRMVDWVIAYHLNEKNTRND